MANSNISWIDFLFESAVYWLYKFAAIFGISYEEINVWIFCIAWPIFSVGSVVSVIYLIRTNRRLLSQKALEESNKIKDITSQYSANK